MNFRLRVDFNVLELETLNIMDLFDKINDLISTKNLHKSLYFDQDQDRVSLKFNITVIFYILKIPNLILLREILYNSYCVHGQDS